MAKTTKQQISNTINDGADLAAQVDQKLPTITKMVDDIITWLKSIGKHNQTHKDALHQTVVQAANTGQVATKLTGDDLHDEVAKAIAKHD